MRNIPRASITGTVLSVVDKPAPTSGKDPKPYRLVKIAQLGDGGDANVVEMKVYNGAKIETGKIGTFDVSLRSWMMKGDRGDMLYGITATMIEK